MTQEAMQQALEALVLHGQQYPHMVKGYCLDAITALREALAEQPAQQEPVAYMYDRARYGPTDLRGQQWLPELSRLKPYTGDDRVRGLRPLYTHPIAQTWAGLTDEEIARVVSLAGFAPDWAEAHIATQIVRVLEAKLKEKNT